jgi:hypothetical protein
MNTRIIAIAAALTALACTTNERNGGLVITKVVTGTAGAAAGGATGCTFNSGGNETVLPDYSVGVSTQGASTGFVVLNQLINPNTVNAQLNTATNTFTAHQAVVDYEIVGASTPQPAIGQQIIPAAGTVPNNFTGAVVVELFSPKAVQDALAGATSEFVRTTTRIEGTLDDGSKVSTSEHEFVIHVCTGATCAADPCF